MFQCIVVEFVCTEELRLFLYFVSNMFSSDKKEKNACVNCFLVFFINFIQFHNQAYSHGMFQIVTCTKLKLKGNSTKQTSIKKNLLDIHLYIY